MESLHIQATESTPEIHLDYAQGELLIKGESYPENVTKCYAPLFDALKSYLEARQNPLKATFELIYFNSSSVKVIMNLFSMLEEAAAAGGDIQVIWRYQDGDETIEEFGEEFSEDLTHARFTMQVISG